MSSKKWGAATLALLGFFLLVLGGLTAVVDPYFHYHAPLDGLAYPINNERYQNNGILKHFDYDAIITGTSMTQNFKASEFDALFGTNSIKIPFSGAHYKEINENLTCAAASNPNIRCILRGLDLDLLLKDKDSMKYDHYPTYLYDRALWNDAPYLLNKSILIDSTLEVLSYTKNGGVTTTFDSYSNWMAGKTFGKEAVFQQYSRPSEKKPPVPFSEADQQILEDNIRQNVTSLIEAYPEITFYLFIPPFSICYMDSCNQGGTLQHTLTAMEKEIELLLPYENVKLFSFFDEFGLITNLDFYKDYAHYSEDVNSQILRWIAAGEHQLTEENYQAYCEKVWDFYTTYDYDALFSED